MSTASTETEGNRYGRHHNRIAKLVTLAVVGLLYGLMVFHQSINTRPSYYAAQTLAQRAALVAQGHAVQARLDQLTDTPHNSETWFATFTDDELNGWLIGELPARFPGALPGAVFDPRVAIEDQRFKLACQYKYGNVEAVLALEAEMFVTSRPNEVGIRLIESQIGCVGGMTEKAAEAITNACARSGIPIRWTDREAAHPEAIVRLPTRPWPSGRQVNVERLELQPGCVCVSARITPAAASRVVPFPLIPPMRKVPMGPGETPQPKRSVQPTSRQGYPPFVRVTAGS